MNAQYKHFMNYGAIAALCSFAFFLLLYFLNINPLGNYSWLGAWVSIVLIYKGTKDFRDKINEGYITYGRALGVAMLLVFFYALLYALLTYLFGKIVAPGIVQMHTEEVMAGMQKMRLLFNEEQFEKMYDQMDKALETFSIGSIVVGDYWNKVIGGLIIGLITSGILKKNKPLFDETTPDSN